MATIEFKAKIEKLYDYDDNVIDELIFVPILERKHCDMDSFRKSRIYGAYANSDLFSDILHNIRERIGQDAYEPMKKRYGMNERRINKRYLKLSDLPNNVTIEKGSLLTKVKIEVSDTEKVWGN